MANGPGTRYAGRELRPVLTTKPKTIYEQLREPLVPVDEAPGGADFKVDLVDAKTGEVLSEGRSWKDRQR